MKRIIAILWLVLAFPLVKAQTPFDSFDSTVKAKPMLTMPEVVYRAYNTDTTSNISYVEYDKYSYTLNYYTSSDSLFSSVVLRPSAQKWNSVDPLAKQYPAYSPYAAFANNPAYYIDPDGKKFINFDAAGNYTGTSHDNFFHNLFVGSKGRILDKAGEATRTFSFADPKNDVKDIQSGLIKSIVVVSDKQIFDMVRNSGAFDPANKTSDKPIEERYDFIKQAGKGGQSMDFSYSAIPAAFPGASDDPLSRPSPMIFLVGETAHNHMNFGNFLFGAAGQALGYTSIELKAGAHYNSLKNSSSNGYPSQWDSADDQFSIGAGYDYGWDKNFNLIDVKPGQLAPTPGRTP